MPIKVVIKGLLRNTKSADIVNDLTDLGFTVNQIHRKHYKAISSRFHSLTLKCFTPSAKMFDLKTLSYPSIVVEGFESKGLPNAFNATNLITRRTTAISHQDILNVEMLNRHVNARSRGSIHFSTLTARHTATWPIALNVPFSRSPAKALQLKLTTPILSIVS
ncbi:hypothetical protein TNCV_4568921 [Trichonephila clavipes]|nr:hypothetical protein TNCV_4568921 [Trichonephila clavipes]